MSAILFKRFLARPLQVAYVLPSSKALIQRVLKRVDFRAPRVIVEFGGGEGCYTREIARKMCPDSKLVVFELDAHLAGHLRSQFHHDRRITILNKDAALFELELKKLGVETCDYVISGIPFSYLEPRKKREILRNVHAGLASEGQFIVYQVTPELRAHTPMFAACQMEYFLGNFPPMFILSFHKSRHTLPEKRSSRNGRGKKQLVGSGK